MSSIALSDSLDSDKSCGVVETKSVYTLLLLSKDKFCTYSTGVAKFGFQIVISGYSSRKLTVQKLFYFLFSLQVFCERCESLQNYFEDSEISNKNNLNTFFFCTQSHLLLKTYLLEKMLLDFACLLYKKRNFIILYTVFYFINSNLFRHKICIKLI